MSLRSKVFDTFKVDPGLNALGINEASLFPNFAPDSPAADLTRFAVIRWGVEEPAAGRDTTARPLAVSLWVYDREPDFAAISAVLRRARLILASLVTSWTGDGYILGADFASSTEDFADPTYAAVGRAETYRIVASGT